jgi:hypothetical protein
MANHSRRFKVGQVVYRKVGSQRDVGRVIEAHYRKRPPVEGQAVMVEWNDSYQQHCLTADLCRRQRDRRTWEASERQGSGRRYWFRDEVRAAGFAANRQRRGYRAIVEGRTAWISLGKRLTPAVARLLGGQDPAGDGDE